MIQVFKYMDLALEATIPYSLSHLKDQPAATHRKSARKDRSRTASLNVL
jgi:hypothetical protein